MTFYICGISDSQRLLFASDGLGTVVDRSQTPDRSMPKILPVPYPQNDPFFKDYKAFNGSYALGSFTSSELRRLGSKQPNAILCSSGYGGYIYLFRMALSQMRRNTTDSPEVFNRNTVAIMGSPDFYYSIKSDLDYISSKNPVKEEMPTIVNAVFGDREGYRLATAVIDLSPQLPYSHIGSTQLRFPFLTSGGTALEQANTQIMQMYARGQDFLSESDLEIFLMGSLAKRERISGTVGGAYFLGVMDQQGHEFKRIPEERKSLDDCISAYEAMFSSDPVLKHINLSEAGERILTAVPYLNDFDAIRRWIDQLREHNFGSVNKDADATALFLYKLYLDEMSREAIPVRTVIHPVMIEPFGMSRGFYEKVLSDAEISSKDDYLHYARFIGRAMASFAERHSRPDLYQKSLKYLKPIADQKQQMPDFVWLGKAFAGIGKHEYARNIFEEACHHYRDLDLDDASLITLIRSIKGLIALGNTELKGDLVNLSKLAIAKHKLSKGDIATI